MSDFFRFVLNKRRPLFCATVAFVLLGACGYISFLPHALLKPTLFQPDSNILNSAVKPSDAVGENSPRAQLVEKNFDVHASPYAYDKTICPHQDVKCFQDFYKNLVHVYGSNTAFFDIKKRYAENQNVVTFCHPLVHVIGEEASKSYKNVSEAYLHGDSFCWSGYYHGVLEGVIDRIGIDTLPKKLDTMCADIPGKQFYNFDYFNCVHGLGHGIMELLSDDVPQSLSMCDNVSGSWEKESCYSGVFMENIIVDSNFHNAKYLKPDEPMYPCTIVGQKYKYQCYLGQTSYALQANQYNFKKVIPLCATVDALFQGVCNESVGRDAANQARHDAGVTKATCDISATVSARTHCVIGAVKEIISYYHSDKEARAFCTILDESDKEICRKTATEYYKLF